jgi:hypothetical protein
MTAVLDDIRRSTEPGYPRVDAQRLIDEHLAIPEHVRDGWRKLVQTTVEQRQVERLHAERDEYLAIVREGIERLEGFADFCRRVNAPGPVPPPLGPRIEAGLRELREFHDTLSGRWKTPDDLYAILVEEYRLPEGKLAAWAAANPPPQSWYDETDDPFAPAED